MMLLLNFFDAYVDYLIPAILATINFSKDIDLDLHEKVLKILEKYLKNNNLTFETKIQEACTPTNILDIKENYLNKTLSEILK